MNVEFHGLEETIRTIVREEIAAVLEQHDGWLSSVEAAAYLELSVGHLRNLTGPRTRGRKVPSHKVGGRRRYRRSELDAYCQGH